MGTPGALLKPAVADTGQALVRQADGTWVPDYVARQQDLDDPRQEFEGHRHDERYGGETPWADSPSLTGGWTHYASSYGPIRYRKTRAGVVMVEGLGTKSGGASVTLMTLPAGFRPGRTLIFNQRADVSGTGETSLRVDVDTAGAIILATTSTASVVNRCSFTLSFYADA